MLVIITCYVGKVNVGRFETKLAKLSFFLFSVIMFQVFFVILQAESTKTTTY